MSNAIWGPCRQIHGQVFALWVFCKNGEIHSEEENKTKINSCFYRDALKPPGVRRSRVHFASRLESAEVTLTRQQRSRCFVNPFHNVDLKNMSSRRAGTKDKINGPIATFHPVAQRRTLPNVDLNWISKRRTKKAQLLFERQEESATLSPHRIVKWDATCHARETNKRRQPGLWIQILSGILVQLINWES